MSTFELVFNIVVTIVGYMGFPFYKFCLSKEIYDLKFKKRVIFLNSVIVAILFLICKIILYGTDNAAVNFAPAFTYYIINRLLYVRKNDNNMSSNNTIDLYNLEDLHDSNFISQEEYIKNKTLLESKESLNVEDKNLNNENKKTKEQIIKINRANKIPKMNKGNFKLIYLIIICVTIILSVGIFSYSNYKKEQLIQEQENERLEKETQLLIEEQNAIKSRQIQLNNCINKAENNRTNLWNSNCTKQSDGSCKIRTDSGMIEWIEQRYQQDLDNCYQLYGN